MSMYGSHHLMSFACVYRLEFLGLHVAMATVAQCAHRAPLGNSNGTCGDSALRCLEKEIEKLPQTLGAAQWVWPWLIGYYIHLFFLG